MIQSLWPLIALIVLGIIVIALKAFLGGNRGGTEDYPYEKECRTIKDSVT